MKPTKTQQNIEARSGNLLGIVKSVLGAAGIAFVIYVVIAALTGGGFSSPVFVVGLEIALFTFIVTCVITAIVGALVRQRRR